MTGKKVLQTKKETVVGEALADILLQSFILYCTVLFEVTQ